jgi:hypothetical protein
MSVIDHLTREEILQMQSAARVYQERADNALAPWDIRAPAPVLGEDIAKYRRDLAVKMKRLLPEGHQLRELQYRRMPNDAFTVFEPQLYRTVRDIAYDPDSVPEGETRRVVSIDSNGMKVVNYVGNHSFVHDFTRPGRRVVGFRTDQGYVNTMGNRLR